MTGLLRLVTLAVALLALLGLTSHRMDAPQGAGPVATVAMPDHDGQDAPAGLAERAACEGHCLAAATPAPAAAPVPAAPSLAAAPGPSLPVDDLSPPPHGPPPKPVPLA